MIDSRLSISAFLLALFQAPILAAPEGTIGRLVRECVRQWAGDNSMIQYCVREQNLSYQRVQQSGASRETVGKCEQRWGDDYSMVFACIKNARLESSQDQGAPGGSPPPQRATPSTNSGFCPNWIMVGSTKACI